MGDESLKAFVRIIISLLLLAIIGFLLNISEKDMDRSQNDIHLNEDDRAMNPFFSTELKMGTLFQLMGEPEKEVRNRLGEPDRREPSAYGYEWWIYNKKKETYVQIGMENGVVVTMYALGEEADIQPFYIAQPIGEIYAMNMIDTFINFEYEGQSYTYELSEEEITTKPLIKMNHIFAQLYIDTFTGKISSIRLMDAGTLIKVRPYEQLFRGDVFEPLAREKVFQKKWQVAEEQQLYELTNIIRARHGASALEKDEAAAKMAYAHSVAMHENKDLFHTRENDEGAAGRVKGGNVAFHRFGENIAADSVDAADVLEGWLKSREYRENLLREDFTHFGVGVYHGYYTQIFLQK